MSRPAIGLLAGALAAATLFPAPAAHAQSALANCKFYTNSQRDFEQGLPYCTQCIEDEPDNPEARYFGAWCLAEMGQWDPAWESFSWLIERRESRDKNIRKYAKEANKKVSQYYATHFNKGVEFLNAGEEKFANAAEEFDIATRINPRKAAAFLNLGYTKGKLGDAAGAMAAFERAIEVDPDNATAYEYYSEALTAKRTAMLAEETANAEEVAQLTATLKAALERVIAAKPANEAALLKLADIALREGDRELAFEYMKRAIDVDPGNVVEMYNVGVRLFEDGDLEAAIETFGIVAEREDDPESDLWRDAKYMGALSLLKLERADESLALVRELLEVDSEQKDYHSLAYQLYLSKQELQKANEHYEKYEQLLAAEQE